MRRAALAIPLLVAWACASVPPAPTPSVPTAYDRDDWPHWIDADGDCQDTRAEVLIEESLAPVTFSDARGCRVTTGRWRDVYTGLTYTEASDLDVDHVVALAAAHASGGWAWDRDRKRAFANDLSDPWHLVAVGASVNRQKGARRPDEWRPPDRAAWCAYARAWRSIKARWQLTIAAGEDAALREMEASC